VKTNIISRLKIAHADVYFTLIILSPFFSLVMLSKFATASEEWEKS